MKIAIWSLNEDLALAMSFIPNQAAIVATMMKGTQMKPAFCSHSEVPAAAVCGSPPRLPNTVMVIVSGTRNCMTLTPRLPSPAFSPMAAPLACLGKKNEMFAMLDEKLPPPRPQSSARISITR
ncbi:hypothetical protein D9M71_658430 [compost metagenome]